MTGGAGPSSALLRAITTGDRFALTLVIKSVQQAAAGDLTIGTLPRTYRGPRVQQARPDCSGRSHTRCLVHLLEMAILFDGGSCVTKMRVT